MSIQWFYHDEEQNLSNVSRAVRLVLGVGLILYTMLTAVTPLGWLAILPLAAIYPMLTALEGWDPVKYLIQNKAVVRFSRNLNPALRVGLGVFGAALIGIVMFSPASVTASLAWLALAAVYPLYAAITGQEPLVSLISGTTTDTAPARKPEYFRDNVVKHKLTTPTTVETPHQDKAA
jgi:hypothetical protein